MKNKIFLIGLLCVLGFAGSGLNRASVTEKDASSRRTSFVRMDLLLKQVKKPGRPSRNIFMPGARTASRLSVDKDTAKKIAEELHKQLGTNAEASTSSPGELSGMEMRYMGYVYSGEKIVALVLYGDEAKAVEKGDWLNEQFRVGNIMRNEITIIGPDSQRRIFPLEGEQR